MATNHTTNYQLNLWEASDNFVREEFNENSQKIDAAIKAVDTKADAKADASAVASLTSQVQSLGAEMQQTGSAMTYIHNYIGYGNSIKALPFNHRPDLVILMAKDGSLPVVFAAYGVAATNNPDVTFHSWPTTGGITKFTGQKYNESGKEYVAIGILNCIF